MINQILMTHCSIPSCVVAVF